MRRLIKVALSSLCRGLASRFTGNMVSDDGDNFLVKNYVLRVLRPLDPHKVRTGAGLDFGVTNLGPQKLESYNSSPSREAGSSPPGSKGSGSTSVRRTKSRFSSLTMSPSAISTLPSGSVIIG